MVRSSRLTLGAAIALGVAACAAPAPRSASPPDTGWATYGNDLGGQRHSPLDSIDTGNVARRVPKWTCRSGVVGTFQATPIVIGHVMYLSLPGSSVVALDARGGRELWRYQHVPRTNQPCCGPANRGVAVAQGTVFVGSVDGRLIALDAASARPLGLRRRQPPGAARRGTARRAHSRGRAGEQTRLVYVHDRRDGRLLFKSDPFVPQRNLFTPRSVWRSMSRSLRAASA